MINPKKATAFLLLFCSYSFLTIAQNDSLKNESLENSKNREKQGDEFFIGISRVMSYRILKNRGNIFGQELGIRADEKPLWTYSFELGYRVKTNERTSLEFGVEYFQMGLQYRTPNDTAFVGYDRKIQGFSTPIRLVVKPFSLGSNGDFKVLASVGIMPKMLMAAKYTDITQNEFGKEERTISKETNSYNLFNFDALVNLGFQWNFGENLGLFFLPEFRFQLLDSYMKQTPYIQRYYGLFLRTGIHWNL